MNLHGWMPARIAWRDSGPRVEWILMGAERLRDPFFVQTMQRQMMKPFHQAFRRETTIEQMVEWTEAHPGAPLRGIVYHMSRCGSTLIGQQLATLDRTIVASEPEPMDDALRVTHRLPGLSRADELRLIRAMAAALAQPRNAEDALYLKTDCWHVHRFDLLREAFPDTPWIFLYRDPVEVMVSQQRMPSAWSVPGLMHPSMLQLDPGDWNPAELDVYCARALAQVCKSGLRAVQQASGGLLVNYSELPEAMYGRLFSHFGLRAEDLPAMRSAAQQNAKAPTGKFTPDKAKKQSEASERLRAVVAEHLTPVYAQLEAERLTRLHPASSAISA
jgi:hypothetical protein